LGEGAGGEVGISKKKKFISKSVNKFQDDTVRSRSEE
jgi:hypothetical protein